MKLDFWDFDTNLFFVIMTDPAWRLRPKQWKCSIISQMQHFCHSNIVIMFCCEIAVWTGLPPYSVIDHQTNVNDDLCIRSKWQWIGLLIFHIQIIVAFELFIFVLGEIVWNHWRSPFHHCNDIHYRHVYIIKREMQFITYLRPAEKTWDKRYFRTVFKRRNCICWYCFWMMWNLRVIEISLLV